MADLFWPGDHRAGNLMSDAALLHAMVAVENVWLTVLVDAGVAPVTARADLSATISTDDAVALADGAEGDGNPVTGLVTLLRQRAGDDAGRWLHRGLTSQDVLDTALLLCLREALGAVNDQLTAQVATLIDLVETHRSTPMLARTLTQSALPSTAGMKFATWLSAVLDACDTLRALPALAVQVGGAAGTMAAATELTGSPEVALRLADHLATALRLQAAPPWHTARSVLTRHGDALVTCCDAWGHLANDITNGSRQEVGELTEGSGGGSSTMPHKSNPVLSILLRRNALAAPPLGATLHAASAASVDERADGGWHTEWATIRTLTRRTVVAASQATDLLAGLQVHTDRAVANLTAAVGLLAEQHTMSDLTTRPPASTYLGATDPLVDAALHRARHHLKESP
jgi:3-carboxy-cis,cis-muconate cycloisomerase